MLLEITLNQFPGDAFSSPGTLQVELGGTMPGVDYDQLLATGSFTAAGTLSVSLINSFAPHAGDNFNILDFASLSGTFANIQLPNLGSSLGWNTSQLYTSGVLSVVSLGVPGDYNNNGTVDAGDYVLWRKYQGTTHVLPNDPTGGTIGTSQYTTWRAHFGQPPGSGSGLAAHTAVPEPTLLVLLLVAAMAIIGRLRLRST
jgi:hypothetical protein